MKKEKYEVKSKCVEKKGGEIIWYRRIPIQTHYSIQASISMGLSNSRSGTILSIILFTRPP